MNVFTTMKKVLASDQVLLILRLGLGGLFLYACWDKILYPDRFALAIRNYNFLPLSLVNLWAICLPWMELLAGLLLVVGLWTRGSSVLTSAMLVSFFIALSSALARGLDISCGCFNQDPSRVTIDYLYLVRDGGLFLLVLPLIRYGGGRFSVDQYLDSGSD